MGEVYPCISYPTPVTVMRNTNRRIQWNEMECVYFIFDSWTLIKLWKWNDPKEWWCFHAFTFYHRHFNYRAFLILSDIRSIVDYIIWYFSSIWAIIRQKVMNRIKSILSTFSSMKKLKFFSFHHQNTKRIKIVQVGMRHCRAHILFLSP